MTSIGLIPAPLRPIAKRLYQFAYDALPVPLAAAHWVATRSKLRARKSRTHRKLEIGPGPKRIPGFETLNVVAAANVDYVWNASKRLPFADGTFELIYASHILEHIPWYRTDEVLREWIRVLERGGRLELWVPDGVKICKAFVEAEEQDSKDFERDGWYRFNEQRDPCVWASGRLFSYGDGVGTLDHPNWHRAVFSFRYLEHALRKAGCSRVEQLNASHVRGHDHGWINLGIAGTK